jgi:ribonucleotide reductase alpha subunit
MFVTKRNGNVEEVQFDKITSRISKLVKLNEKKYIDPILVAQKVVGAIYSGITTEELDNESAKICINLCTSHPSYSSLAGRIVVSNLHKKTINTFVEKQENIQKKLNLLDNSWLLWIVENRDSIDSMIHYDRDYLFDYFGFKTLEKGYLTKIGDETVERPQDMFMRVASFINKGDLILVKKTYDLLSLGYYTHASPTLFNAGNKTSQLASCFLLGTEDTLEGITKTWSDVAKISKWGGGIGLHISNIRAKHTMIKGTNGPSSGIVPMLKVYNEIARYIDQCFIGSTKIYTGKGLIAIDQIRPGDTVFTMDGSLQKVKKVYCDEHNGKILSLKIYHDYENIKVTLNHPFLVIKNKSTESDLTLIVNRLNNKTIAPEWIEAKNISSYDFIGLPIPKYVIDNLNLDEADCYFYGLVLDCCVIGEDNKYIMLISLKKKYIIEFVQKYLATLGVPFIVNVSNDNLEMIWVTSSKLKFVRSQFYLMNIKHFDDTLLHLPENKVKWIVKAIVDNSVLNTNITIGDEISIEVSINLVDSIKFILLRMGVLCPGYLRKHINSTSEFCTCVLVIPKTKKISELFDIIQSNNLKYIINNDVVYTQLERITEENISTCVYDLEVQNNHNYLTQAGLVHNGGKRKGSVAIYLEPHHADILSFLDLKKNFGAETERARDLFLALWVSDLFMKQVDADADWYLMCPDKCPGLTDVYGDKFEELYWSYVKDKKYNTVVKARTVMTAILDSQLETGTPYITFKDHANRKTNQKNIGTIKSSNLCNEILEYSDSSEYAVCNLASIAINKFVKPFECKDVWRIRPVRGCKYYGWIKHFLINSNYLFEEVDMVSCEELEILTGVVCSSTQIYYGATHIGDYSNFFEFICGTFDYEELYNVVYTSALNLNNIIDLSFYPVIEAKKSNIRHRPIAIGIQGLADALVLLKIRFDSEKSIEFNKKFMETIYLAAMTASNDIAKSRYLDMNTLITFSIVNNLPEYYDPLLIVSDMDLNKLYHRIKPNKCELDNEVSSYSGSYSTFKGSPISQGLFQFDLWSVANDQLFYEHKWKILRENIKIYGVRNSLVTALMPTASTSQILGNNECFEYFTNNIYTRRTLAGDFPVVNKYLINDLDSIGLWNNEMKQLILANNGSISNFQNIPNIIRNLYQTIWDIKQVWVLKNAVARGPFVDQTQSMNIFMATPDSQKLYSSHFWSWRNGLKTGIYYLRSKPAKDATKITIDANIQDKLLSITNVYDVCENCSA